MSRFNFSKEPIVWVSAIVAVMMLVRDWMSGELNIQSLDAALVVIGGVAGRHYVSPVDEKG